MSASHIAGIAQATTKQLNSRLSLTSANWALCHISYLAMSATVLVSERGLFDGSVDVTLGHFPSWRRKP
ncbi:MAG: hypothetical protein H7175_11900 [Burkholderiales bacterium]|nr:hypothetical protein [Anaerolineae bacterium]